MAIDIPSFQPPEAGGLVLSAFNKAGSDANALSKGQLENKMQQIQNMYQPQKNEADINSINAVTNKINQMTPLDVAKLQAQSPYWGPQAAADVREKEQLANYYAQGGGRQGASTMADIYFDNQVAIDNPTLQSPEDKRDASNAVREGKFNLPDGRPIIVTQKTKDALAGAMRYRTTAALTTQGVRANQASAEMDAINEDVNSDLQPYANTFGGYSPQQILDSISSSDVAADDASQKRLGRLIASQAAQYEIAQLRNRVAGGEPGINATQELESKSGQVLKTVFPRLSAVARKEANDRLNYYIKKMLAARNKVGISTLSATGVNNPTSKANTSGSDNGEGLIKYKIVDGKLVRQS